MSSTAVLLLNGLMLALGMSFMLTLLLANIRGEINQFFALFWLMLLLWHAGAMLVQISELVTLPDEFASAATGMMELGFTATSVALYALTTALVSVLSRRARLMVFASIGLLIALRTLLVVTNAPSLSLLNQGGTISEGRSLYILFYLLFDGATLFLLWQSRRRLRSAVLIVGIALFALGQGIGFLNPALGTHITSLFVSAVGGLVLSYAILHQEIIRPLGERISQVAAVRDLSRSITSRDPLHRILEEVTQQAVGLLHADAVALFLFEDAHLQLAAGASLPTWFYTSPRVGEGLVSKCMAARQALRVDSYERDWKGAADLPYAPETFGSVMAAPLIYGADVIGAMLVIAGKHSLVYTQEDVYLLQLLAAQVSVAIANNRMLTEQNALTEQIELAHGQLEAVLVSTENPVLAIDRAFRLIFANPAAKALFEVPALNGEARIFDYFPSHPHLLPPQGRDALHILRQQRSLTYELTFHNRTYLCHAAPLGEGRSTGWVIMLNDVTELKELDRMKSEMVRMTSHDLKNPLQAAMANLELLRDDLYDGAGEEVRLSIDNVDKQLIRMNRIISGILDLERLKGGRMALETCNPAEIAARALHEVGDSAREHQITLSMAASDTLPTFAGDSEQVSRALVNLLENAVKFTPDQGSVRLEVRLNGNDILFAVMDTGVGIPPAHHLHVFERFFRANQPGVEHVTGTGLGLSLVKAVAESHRGRVWFDSTEGVGSTFFLSVPVTAPGARSRPMSISSTSYSQI